MTVATSALQRLTELGVWRDRSANAAASVVWRTQRMAP